MNIFNRVLTMTTVATTLSLSAMATVAATVPAHHYPEVVIKETIVTQSVDPVPVYRDITTTPAFAHLNLSSAQKQQIKKINAQYPSQLYVLTDDDRALQALHQQRHELIVNKRFDEAKARSILSQEGKILIHKQQQRADIELQKLKRNHAIYHVLTPKQRDQLIKQREKNLGW